MSKYELEELAMEWDSQEYDPEIRLNSDTPLFAAVLKEVLFHAEYRFWQFTPAYVETDFLERLVQWLNNSALCEADMKVLFRLVPYLEFIDRDDMLSLYRSAFTGPITHWLMDEEHIDFKLSRSERQERFATAVRETWFCSVTDSMDIAQFHHINGLAGKGQRPSWKMLKSFGDPDKIRDYMRSHGFKRLVLLEDFVGSGTQTRGPVKFAFDLLHPEFHVMFLPLIVSGLKLKDLRDFFGKITHLKFEQLLTVPEQVHVQDSAQDHEPLIYKELRDIVMKTFDTVKQPVPPETEILEHPFGFQSCGMLTVLYTNCPNNTVPAVWNLAPEWKPLFPRVARA